MFEVVVKQHPSFSRFIDEDAWYGWVQKNPDAPRRYELASSRPPLAVLLNQIRSRRHARKTSAGAG